MSRAARVTLSSLLITACGPETAETTTGSAGGSTTAAAGTTTDAGTTAGSLTDAPDPTTGAGPTTTDGASADTDAVTTSGATTSTTGGPGTSDTGETNTTAASDTGETNTTAASDTGETNTTAASDTGDTADTGAPGCAIVESLVIDDNTDLDALGCIEEVNGDVTIGPTIALTSLAPLKNLRRVGGTLDIHDNAALVDLTGLDGLEEVGERLKVRYNAALVTMDGLAALTRLNALAVTSNDSLVALSSFGGAVEFGPWGYFELDDLPKLKSLKSLAGLKLITADTTTIQIRVEHNQALTDLTGLGACCTGAHVDLAVLGNHALPSLAGLEPFTALGRLELVANHTLKDLSGLGGVKTIEWLEIGMQCYDFPDEPSPVGNDSLVSLAGLNALTAVTIQLSIMGNKKLPVAAANAFEDMVAKNTASEICENQGGFFCESVLCPP